MRELKYISSKNQSKDIHTIHKPSSIRGDLSFGDDEVKICQNLYNLQQNSWFVNTVNLPITFHNLHGNSCKKGNWGNNCKQENLGKYCADAICGA